SERTTPAMKKQVDASSYTISRDTTDSGRPGDAETAVKVTGSVGPSCGPRRSGQSFEEVALAADRALYRVNALGICRSIIGNDSTLMPVD
ncbi:hypothetical protein, partial [uncultured Jannaschia sp.]|uniref:hypothetical protein n=1 Tax=uncultured Jannaschia sp. TaxID=293347 RepID=UPI002602B3E5